MHRRRAEARPAQRHHEVERRALGFLHRSVRHRERRRAGHRHRQPPRQHLPSGANPRRAVAGSRLFQRQGHVVERRRPHPQLPLSVLSRPNPAHVLDLSATHVEQRIAHRHETHRIGLVAETEVQDERRSVVLGWHARERRREGPAPHGSGNRRRELLPVCTHRVGVRTFPRRQCDLDVAVLLRPDRHNPRQIARRVQPPGLEDITPADLQQPRHFSVTERQLLAEMKLEGEVVGSDLVVELVGPSVVDRDVCEARGEGRHVRHGGLQGGGRTASRAVDRPNLKGELARAQTRHRFGPVGSGRSPGGSCVAPVLATDLVVRNLRASIVRRRTPVQLHLGAAGVAVKSRGALGTVTRVLTDPLTPSRSTTPLRRCQLREPGCHRS